MPDEAKKLIFFNTKVDHVMHKLPADYVINLGGDTYSFALMDIVWIYMDIMKLMPTTTRQDLVADVFFQRTAIAKSLDILY